MVISTKVVENERSVVKLFMVSGNKGSSGLVFKYQIIKSIIILWLYEYNKLFLSNINWVLV